MIAGNLQSYRFKGIPAEGTGRTLAEAIEDLSGFWMSRPTLLSHNWGVLTLQITVGATPVTLEIADPDVLDDLSVGDTSSLVTKLAKDMQLDLQDAEMLLSETTEVVATVDRIRPPDGSGMMWKEDPSLSPAYVMPQASMEWLSDVGRQVDLQIRRDHGRPRSRRGKDLLRLVVGTGHQQGLTDASISRRTQIPISTVRDTWERIQREQRVAAEFKNRKRGQRYTAEQKAVVQSTLEDTDGNAAETARRLGLAPRTVRDLKLSLQRTSSVKAASRRRSYTETDKASLLDMVRSKGLTATEAARKLGISDRTARGWVRQAKIDSAK